MLLVISENERKVAAKIAELVAEGITEIHEV